MLFNKITIGILALILIAFIIVLISAHKEFFDSNSTVITTNPLNHVNSTGITFKPYDIESWEFIVNGSKNVSGASAVICDPYDAHILFPNTKAIALDKGYFVSLMTPDNAFNTECSFDWSQKKVGIIDRSSKLFASAIIQSYHIDASIVQIPMDSWDKLDRILANGEVDVIVVYFVPFSPMNRLLLNQQFSIMGFSALDYDRLQVTYPYFKKTNVDLSTFFKGTNSYILAREKNTVVPEMQLQWIDLTEGFMTQFESESDRFDPMFHCYGDNTIDIKGLCNSSYTTFGMKKPESDLVTKWDSPCLKNEDCPFFQANKNYSNQRGGCVNRGMCELPIGVKRTGYRKYLTDAPYNPICHGCVSDPDCCEKQKKNKKMKSPDYAFVGDNKEREAGGLPYDSLDLTNPLSK